MSSRDVEYMLEMLAGSLGSLIGPIIASVLSGVILTYCIRWFIFAKAGEKGWKALIPFYSEYINYKIAWDGRIYIALLVGTVASFLLGSIFGLINAGLGMVVSVLTSTVVAGAKAVAGMILQFKMSRAFGKGDFFAVGLYFLSNVFTAILAFGECEYKGAPTKDGIGVPKFIENFGKKKNDAEPFPPMAAPFRPVQPVQPAQPGQPVQPVQRPVQQPVQQNYQGYQQPYNTGNFAPVQQYPQQQPYNTGNYAPVQQYPQQMGQQPANQQNQFRS